MGSGNLTPLEELKRLDQQIDQIHSLVGLQPLFTRLEEITKLYSADFEVQLVAHDVKQHILSRGSRIKQTQPVPVPIVTPPLAEPAPAPEAVAVPSAAAKTPAPGRRKGLLWAFAAILAIAGIAITAKIIQDRNAQLAATTPMDSNIATAPSGAAIAINGQPACTADCVAKLTPGTYRVTASLDGYESATGDLTVSPGRVAALKLTLAPQAPSVRIFADLAKGQVFLDDKPAGDLQDGQLTLERLETGQHTIRVTGGTSEASFSVTVAPASVPVVEGPIATKNLLAVVVANLGLKARLISSSGPLKLALNGQEEAPATPEGTDLTAFRTGPAEIVLGEGSTQRNLTAAFSPAPTLTAFLKTDQKIGNLLITTGQDDVRIFLNNRENRRRTAKGQARVQTFGDVTVRVEKPGFEAVPPQTVKVEQGAEVKLNFNMKPVPKFSAISVSGAPGTQILLSDTPLGTVGSDGAYRNTSIAPGDHTIELRRDQFEPKRFTRTFRAGETVVIGVADATLTAIRLPPPPVVAPPALPKPEPAPVKLVPRVVSGDISNFDNPGAWALVQGVWRHRGEAALTYSLPPNGIFTFSIYMLKSGGLLRGGKVRWFLNYTDAKNYAVFELDEENFWSRVVANGKSLERKKAAHKQDKSMRVWNIQIDASATRVVHKIQGDNGWVDLDTWTEPGRNFTEGKFGILVNGSDEVGLSNFTFTGR